MYSPISRKEWASKLQQNANANRDIIAALSNVTVKSRDKMQHPTKEPVDPGTVTPMYRINSMTECEMNLDTLNGSGSYELQLEDDNIFNGTLSTVKKWQNSRGSFDGTITVMWTNCACFTHDGDLVLYQAVDADTSVIVTMTGKEHTIIKNGKLISGQWPLFLSIYMKQ